MSLTLERNGLESLAHSIRDNFDVEVDRLAGSYFDLTGAKAMELATDLATYFRQHELYSIDHIADSEGNFTSFYQKGVRIAPKVKGKGASAHSFEVERGWDVLLEGETQKREAKDSIYVDLASGEKFEYSFLKDEGKLVGLNLRQKSLNESYVLILPNPISMQ